MFYSLHGHVLYVTKLSQLYNLGAQWFAQTVVIGYYTSHIYIMFELFEKYSFGSCFLLLQMLNLLNLSAKPSLAYGRRTCLVLVLFAPGAISTVSPPL